MPNLVATFTCPADAQLYVAVGAALLATGSPVTLAELGTRLATRKAIDGAAGPADPAVREAAMFVAQSLSVVAPYVAEEMWEVLGLPPSIANSQWPVADASLTVDDTATMVVQIQGKIRAKLEVPADITEEAALELALADDGVKRSLDGREVIKVIARLPKMLSLVPGK